MGERITLREHLQILTMGAITTLVALCHGVAEAQKKADAKVAEAKKKAEDKVSKKTDEAKKKLEGKIGDKIGDKIPGGLEALLGGKKDEPKKDDATKEEPKKNDPLKGVLDLLNKNKK